MVSVMARVALHNLFLDLQKRSKLYSGSAFHRNESWLKRGKETETLVPKESPVTYPKTMLFLCRNLSLVDFYFWRSVAFTFYLFPCARLRNPVLEAAMLRAVVWPCDLLGSFPNQIIPWFCETVWKHGWQFWVWHVAPKSDSSVFPEASWVAGLAEGWRKAPKWAAWTLRSVAGGQQCKDFKTPGCSELWELKARHLKVQAWVH